MQQDILVVEKPADGTEQSPVIHVEHDGKLLAIIVPANFQGHGIHFFTDNALSQQLAYMHHPAGKIIEPHLHNLIPREVCYTQEVLVIRRGRLRVDFYDAVNVYIGSRILASGDIILLIAGGHGFEALEELEMIEVKQGPYIGEADKTRFPGVAPAQLRIGTGAGK